MSAHLHHGFLRYYGPRKVRRSWGRSLLSVLVLLLLSGLAGWLWSYVRHAALPERAIVRVPGLAMMPLGVIDGHGAAALACLAVGLPGIAWAVVWVVRKLKAFNDEARGALNEEQGEDAELAETRWCVAGDGVKKLPVDDLCRILEAACVQAERVRGIIQDSDELLVTPELRAAYDEQCLLIGCLQGLLQTAQKAAASAGWQVPDFWSAMEKWRLSASFKNVEKVQAKTKCIYCPNCGVLAGIGEDRRS